MLSEPETQPRRRALGKARRIQDADWDSYRPMIEKLYGDEGLSKKMILDRLKQHGFTVT